MSVERFRSYEPLTTITLDGKQTEIEQQSAKTKSSLRTLPLIGSFREYFLQVKEAQELNKQICGNCHNYEYDGFVFVDELGERMRVDYLTNAFPKFLESHGLQRMRFYDLRHSCASLLLANGVPMKQIQEWLGHSDFGAAANIYAHLDSRRNAQWLGLRAKLKKKSQQPEKPTTGVISVIPQHYRFFRNLLSKNRRMTARKP